MATTTATSSRTSAQVTAALNATAAKQPNAAPKVSAGNSGTAAPVRGSAGWIDPIRALGDTKFTDQYGTPTQNEVANASSPDAATAAPVNGLQAPTGPVQPTPPSQGQTNALGSQNSSLAPIATLAASPTPTQTKYQTGLQNAQASGQPPPATAGAAASAVQQYTPPSPPDSTNVDNLFQSDPQIQGIMKNVNTLLSAQNQVPSIMQDYNKLKKDSGLDKINQELIDADTVINGTEDDIRNEIQTAGGMGTESQVQAMTLARNKNLLLRYNQLTQQKTDATNQLNTMLQLTQQDRQMAQERINTALTANFQMANFRQTALQNTRQQQQFLIQQDPVGYYNSLSKDPRQLAMAESIMGTGPGGIQQIAQHAKEQQDFARSVQEQQLAISRGNLGVAQGGLALEREKFEYSKTAAKPKTQAQAVAEGYAKNATAANAIASKLDSKFASPLAFGGIKIPLLGGLPNVIKSGDRQQYEQAKRDFINAVLRPESGAAIAQSEFDNADAQYFPHAGDSAIVVAQKQANRQEKINALYNQANTVQSIEPGQMVLDQDGGAWIAQ